MCVCSVTMWLSRVLGGVGVQISGNKENIKAPCVIVSNHQSFWETIYLQVLLYPLSTVLKRSLLRIPGFGWALSTLQPIAIDRNEPVKSLRMVKQDSITRLQQGRNVLIFPEGTRNPVGKLGSYTRSAADIAKSANVPIIALAHDSGKYWLNKKYSKRPGIINLVISEPIIVGDQNTKEVMAQIRDWTQKQLDSMA